MFDGIKETLRLLSDTVFPGHCVACGKISETGAIFCRACEKQLETPSKRCLVCGQAAKTCKCADHVFHYDRAAAPYFNTGPARHAVYALKFAGRSQVIGFLADQMAATVRECFGDLPYDAVIPVPCRRIDRIRRGYDHAGLLAQALAQTLRVPLCQTALLRRGTSTRQHRMPSVEQRFIHARDAYKTGRPVRAERVLLVDDILTSGATLDACARLLKQSGVKQVDCMTAVVGKKAVEKKDKMGYNNNTKEEVSGV